MGCLVDQPSTTSLGQSATDLNGDADSSVQDLGLMTDIRVTESVDMQAAIDLSLPIDMAEPDQLLMDATVDMGPTSGAFTTAQVDEIFQRDCGSCHNSTASPPLNNGVRPWINRGSGQSRLRLIQPGNHQQSYLYHKLADTHAEPPSNGSGTGMPMGRQLYSEGRLERFALWIDAL